MFDMKDLRKRGPQIDTNPRRLVYDGTFETFRLLLVVSLSFTESTGKTSVRVSVHRDYVDIVFRVSN